MTVTRSPIARLVEFGQSPWYDNLTRGLITGGGLTRLIEDDGIRGVTSNPTIFEKAMASGEGYDEQLTELAAGGAPIDSTYWALVLDDIRHAADVLRPTYDALDGTDGFVSVEVAPDRAYETAATIEQVHWLHDQAARPNVFVKIPATLAGVPAIEECLAEGISINITLIFSLARYAEVIGGVPARARTARRAGRRPLASRVRGVVLRQSRRHRSRPSPARRPPAAGQGRRRQRQARLRAVPGDVSPATAGKRSPPVARVSSARCGRRPRPRTPPTPTRSTSTSWSGPTRSTRSHRRRSTRCTTTAIRNPTRSPATSTVHGASSRTWPARRIDYGDLTDTLEREGVDSFERSYRDCLSSLEKRAGELIG